MVLPLPGLRLEVSAGDAAAVFSRRHDDPEIESALHRFAWLPLCGRDVDGAVADALWREWLRRYGDPDGSLAWEAYTAAERALNLLDFSARDGLPGDPAATRESLIRHGWAILERLEYSGDHDTGNHLANNGRGLLRLGLELDVPEFVRLGGTILVEEARRLFLPSGMLREGSTHYHLLLSRFYADAWLSAQAHGADVAVPLERIVSRCLAVIPQLMLPAGLPLIGDVSPDCPPEFLSGLHAGSGPAGWLDGLPDERRKELLAVRDSVEPVSSDDLARDGWTRLDASPWSALCYVSADGWPVMPGHAHQDCGSFELHCLTDRVFIDPGRRRYGETPSALEGWGGRFHNTVLVDGEDPYPPNKPYYDTGFRARVAGATPSVTRQVGSLTLSHAGFSRLGGVGTLTRQWRFGHRSVTISDSLGGSGRRRISRCLHTALPASKDGDSIVLLGTMNRFRLSADVPLSIREAACWPAYGVARPAWAIDLTTSARLPWSGTMVLEIE